MDLLTQRPGRGRDLVLSLLAAVGMVLSSTVLAQTATAATGDIGTPGPSYTSVTGTEPPTADKPQSKLWYNDGSWWAIMLDDASKTWHIFRLDRSSETWRDTKVQVDNRPQSLADALWDGSKLYIGSHWATVSTEAAPKASTVHPARLYRYSYDRSRKTYTLDAGFPSSISNSSSESLTIDKDSTGRIWATWTQVSGSALTGYTSAVYVNSATNGGATWGDPMVLPGDGANIEPDDISSLVAYDKNKIGVMWSNQRVDADAVYWASHTDGQPASAWTVDKVFSGTKQADDHIDVTAMQSDSQGRVVAVVKTSLDQLAGAPRSSNQIDLLLFRPRTDSWTRTTYGTLADCHTRPIVVLDQENAKVHVFATAPSSGSCSFSGQPGTIYEKVAPLSDLSFPAGRGTPVIRDAASPNMNNATSTKQPVTSASGLVVLASNDVTKRYWHADIAVPPASKPPTNGGPKPAGWRLVVNDQFGGRQLPAHWLRGNGRMGSDVRGCARASHAFAKGGSLQMVMRYRRSGACGRGWYSASLKLARSFASVDQKISLRFRVTSVRGVHARRIIPMRAPVGATGSSETYCGGTALRSCDAVLSRASGAHHRFRTRLTKWHTMTFIRSGYTVQAFIDGHLRWTYRGTSRTLPASLRTPMLQQQCAARCPSGRRGKEVVSVDWIKVWNPTA